VAIASFICLGLNMGLLRYLYLIENPSRTSRHRKAHDS
jgi:hypothetical protein